MQQIHHKKNELFKVELYKDKECTEAFNFTNVNQAYIELSEGDATPLLGLGYVDDLTVYTGYFAEKGLAITLDDITPNLSKYIPEDNAVLFLDGEKISLLEYDDYYNMFSGYRDIEFQRKIIEGMPYHPQIYGIHTIGDRVSVHEHEYDIDDYTHFTLNILKGKKLTIFLHHGTQAELQKANEVAKELGEKYKVEEVSVIALHWFGSKYEVNAFEIEYLCEDFGTLSNINKIITTNSTGILKPEDSKGRLQVIDCKEIFEEYLQNKR